MNIAGAPKDDNTHRLAVLNNWVVPNSFTLLSGARPRRSRPQETRARMLFSSLL
jgi:hypothetical protein